MSNLQLRVVSAVVLAIITLGLTWLGGLPFRLLCAAMAAVIFYEWTRMSRPAATAGLGFLPEALLLVFIGALIAGLPASWLLPLVAVLVAVTAIAASIRKTGQWDASGLAYAAVSGLSLALLRDGDRSGLVAILFLFAVVWATDIFCLFRRPRRRRSEAGAVDLARQDAERRTRRRRRRRGRRAAPGRCGRRRQSRRARCGCARAVDCRPGRRPFRNHGSNAATAARIRAR